MRLSGGHACYDVGTRDGVTVEGHRASGRRGSGWEMDRGFNIGRSMDARGGGELWRWEERTRSREGVVFMGASDELIGIG